LRCFILTHPVESTINELLVIHKWPTTNSHFCFSGRIFKSANSTTTKISLLRALVWSVAIWRVDSLQQRTKVHRCLWNVVLYKAPKKLMDTTQDEWMDHSRTGSRKGRVKSLKLCYYGHTTRKYESLINPGMYIRKQKSWSTTQTLDGRHRRVDRADD